MASDLMALLLTGSFNAVTIATVASVGFPRPETRFTLVVTLLLVSAVLTLALLVFLPHHMGLRQVGLRLWRGHRGTGPIGTEKAGELEQRPSQKEASRWSIGARRLLASSLLSAVFVFAGGGRPASGQHLPAATPQPEETLAYRIHKGESLADIARVFHLSPDELAQANGITDPTRLQIAQPLKIPNVFARQAAQLREERDGLAAEKAQLVRQVAAQAQVLAAKDQQIQHQEREKAAMARELARAGYWQGGVYLLAALFLGALGWGVWLQHERNRQTRRLSMLAQENAALSVTREKYRQAVAHLELRYQQLTSPRGVSDTFVTEGRALLSRAFTEGCARLEEMLTNLKAEREKRELLRHAEQQRFASLLHLLRRLRYRSPLNDHRA